MCPSLSWCSWSHQVKLFEMGWDRQLASKDCKGAPDLAITNAVVVDWTGIYQVRKLLSFFTQYTLDDPSQADIGVRDGIIVGTGKPGNPDDLDCVDPCLVIDSSAEVIAGEKLIITAHTIDPHVLYIFVHSLSPKPSRYDDNDQGRERPEHGYQRNDVHVEPLLYPAYVGCEKWSPDECCVYGEGESGIAAMEEAGAVDLKLHEGWGSTPAATSKSLDVADMYDVQVGTLSDLSQTLSMYAGRSISTQIHWMRADL